MCIIYKCITEINENFVNDAGHINITMSMYNLIEYSDKLESLESSLCDYSDAYILITGNINVTGGDNNTKVTFKNCASFTNA